MEIAQGRFPFPPPGHPPLSMIDLVQYLLEVDIASLLEDDPDHNLHWSKAFRHFLAKWYYPLLFEADWEFGEGG
jgi:mitogen-activated protein kinase kinase